MNGLNKVLLIGNLGKDTDLRTLENGSIVATFPLATSEAYRDREGNKVDKTEWHNIVIWKRGLAELAKKYLQKGAKVYIEGKISYRSWVDKEGNKRFNTEIIVDNIILLDKQSDRKPRADDAAVNEEDFNALKNSLDDTNFDAHNDFSI